MDLDDLIDDEPIQQTKQNYKQSKDNDGWDLC